MKQHKEIGLKPARSIAKTAKIFRASRSGHYAWLSREPSRHEKSDLELLRLIMQIFGNNFGRYGSPRAWRGLVEDFNQKAGRKRVERLMRKHGLRAKGKWKRAKTTDSRHSLSAAGNLLNRNFTAAHPGEKRASGITYLRTAGGFQYLAATLDLWGRKAIGWNIAEVMRHYWTSPDFTDSGLSRNVSC